MLIKRKRDGAILRVVPETWANSGDRFRSMFELVDEGTPAVKAETKVTVKTEAPESFSDEPKKKRGRPKSPAGTAGKGKK